MSMQNTVRDLNDWITGFAAQEDVMRGKLDRPVPDYNSRNEHLTSQKLGWRGLSFAQNELPAGAALPAESPARHRIVLSLARGRLVRGDDERHELRAGSVVVLPASDAGAWRTHESLRYCVISIDSTMLARAAVATYGAVAADFELGASVRDYDFGIAGLAGVLAEEAGRGARGNNLYVNSLADMLAVHLLRHYARWRRAGPKADEARAFERALNAPEAVQRAIVYIRENHTREVGVQEIAAAAGTNPFQLARLFEERLGTAPYQYLLRLRVQVAQSLLAAGARSMAEVAQAVGFGDQGALAGHAAGQRQGLGSRG